MKKNSSIKIYWVALVWAKWQIILPSESRNDFEINIWKNFKIHSVYCSEYKQNIAFSIYENEEKIKKLRNWKNILTKNNSEIKIWTKFQFVIPAKIREDLEIIPWNSIIVVWKSGFWLWFIKNDKINYLFKFIKEELNF